MPTNDCICHPRIKLSVKLIDRDLWRTAQL